MKHSLTIAFITNRLEPKLDWFKDSLLPQIQEGEDVRILVIDGNPNHFPEHPVKPNIWSGGHRIMRDHWWSAAAARNTAICLCQTEWIAFCDDRAVLCPAWLESIRLAMLNQHVVCGSYEKHHNMVVENGIIKDHGTTDSVDHREEIVKTNRKGPTMDSQNGGWLFGCSFALPLEWALEVNGLPEECDGLGMEDVMFGVLLTNNNRRVVYDVRMKIIEDRTPGQCLPVFRKEDKGKSPNDLSHHVLKMIQGQNRSRHYWHDQDLRQVRERVLAGEPFPVPSKKEYRHFWDNTPMTQWFQEPANERPEMVELNRLAEGSQFK